MKLVWKYCICFYLFIVANPTAQTISTSAFASLNYNYYGLLNLAQTPVQNRIYTTVAVLEFEVEGLSKLEGQALTDRFTSELEKTQSIEAIVNREKVSEIMDELETERACKTDSCAIVLGSMLGVDYVVKGTVISEVGWFTLEFDLLSVEKKDVVENRKSFYNGDPNGLITEIGLVAWNLVNKVSPRELLKEKEEKAREAIRLAEERAEAARIAAAKKLRRAKLNALIRSSILPGWGQFYSGRKTSGWAWLGSELAIGTLAIVSYTQYNNVYSDFEDVYTDYNTATDHAEIAALKVKAKKVLDEEYAANDQLKMVAYAGGAVWIANMIHAYIAGPIQAETAYQKAGFDFVFDPDLKTPQLRFYIALD